MIVISMVLVIVGAVTLGIGVFVADDDLTLVYVSILSCLLAGVFLIVGIVRGSPRRRAASEPAPRAAPTWAGSGAPAGPGPRPVGGQAAPEPVAAGSEEETAAPAGRVQVVTAEDAAADGDAERWQPVTAGAAVPSAQEEPAGDEDVTAPVGAPAEPSGGPRKRLSLRKGAAPEPRRGQAAVPEPGVPGEQPDVPAEEPAAPEVAVAPVPAKKAAKKAAAKKAAKKAAPKKAAKKAAPKKAAKKAAAKKAAPKKAAKKAAAKKAAPKKVAAKKAAAKKVAGKKAAAKKAGVRKASAKKAAGPSGEASRRQFRSALASVSGVGPAKVETLFERFGSVSALRSSNVSEIAATPGVSPTVARRILDELG